MRKVVKRADGHEETIEGTPEEIREYERIVENDRVPKQKRAPELIKGRGGDPEPDDSSSKLRRLLKEIEERNRKLSPPTPWQPWVSPGPIWITSCSQCHRNPCACRQQFWDRTKIYCLGSSDCALD
jgi:hypothetical protein